MKNRPEPSAKPFPPTESSRQRRRIELGSSYDVEPQEVFGKDAIIRIAKSLPPLERAYAQVRFTILRPKLLSVMDLLLTDEGRILDVGCGFGLFAAYFGQTQPNRHILGIDPDARRVNIARRVAIELGLSNQSFLVGDVRRDLKEQRFDAAYVLDVMHHIPKEHQIRVLEQLRDALVPGGTLLIKDITTEPRYGLLFTEYLDRLMVGWNEPLAYRHHREWGSILRGLGFKVRIVRVPDILPYPHVVISATKMN